VSFFSRELPSNIVISLRYSHLVSIPAFFIIIRVTIIFVITIAVVANDVIHNIYIVCIIYTCVCARARARAYTPYVQYIQQRCFLRCALLSHRLHVLYIYIYIYIYIYTFLLRIFYCAWFENKEFAVPDRKLFHPWTLSANIKAKQCLRSSWLDSRSRKSCKKWLPSNGIIAVSTSTNFETAVTTNGIKIRVEWSTKLYLNYTKNKILYD